MMQTFPTPEALAEAVARHVVTCGQEALSAHGRFVIALSGGSTPQAAYSRLVTLDSRPPADARRHPAHEGRAPATDDPRPMRAGLWRLTHVLWGDERCVPPDDLRSNYRMAKEALLDRVPIPPEQIHRIHGEDDPGQAAADYERELRDLLAHPERGGDERHPERSEGSLATLDLVLLGLGEDGHTASLFPGQPSVHETERWVSAVLAPDGKLWRVTLTPAILNRAKNVSFVVSGANKAHVLQRVLEQPFNPDALPAQSIRPAQGRLTWMVDESAARLLRPARAST
jgi:6-phosphogluconolactonase